MLINAHTLVASDRGVSDDKHAPRPRTAEEAARDWLQRACLEDGLTPREAIYPPNELHFDAPTTTSLENIAERLKVAHYFIATMVANEEPIESGQYQMYIYYVFSHPDLDLFISVRVALSGEPPTYWSIRDHFQSVAPFEEEMRDLFGLGPTNRTVRAGTRLHPGCFPPEGFFPLRREQPLAQLRQRALAYYELRRAELPPRQWLSHYELPAEPPPEGEMLIPVGPIHAGVIEPGHFLFHIGLQGERIRQMEMRLGYIHRGIERLFQEYEINDAHAVRLAEMVSNDSAFAHAYAYCRAVEKLTSTPVPILAESIRACLLELERMANHIGDIGALAHDTGRELLSTDFGMLRERVMELCREVAGNRLLMGVNIPGGVNLPQPLDQRHVLEVAAAIESEFGECVTALETPGFRRRTVNVGVLNLETAEQFGVTGMAARASGRACDFRLLHPELARKYTETTLRTTERPSAKAVVHGEPDSRVWARLRRWLCAYGFMRGDEYAGDVYSRFRDRVRQVHLSVSVIRALIVSWPSSLSEDKEQYRAILHPIHPDRAYQPFLGYSEGWRASIVYWLMVDDAGQIYRCKVADGSMLAWPALAAAVQGNQLCDFPLINKSFNLSYSANDL